MIWATAGLQSNASFQVVKHLDILVLLALVSLVSYGNLVSANLGFSEIFTTLSLSLLYIIASKSTPLASCPLVL